MRKLHVELALGLPPARAAQRDLVPGLHGQGQQGVGDREAGSGVRALGLRPNGRADSIASPQMRPDPGSRIPATLVALALVVLLAGCGMGGGRAKPTVIPLAATQGGVPERMGVFVQTPDGLLELREWSMVFVQAPPDTGRLKSDQVRGFLIHQRNVYELDRTRLWVVGTNTEVKMTLEPAPEQQAAWVRLPASLGSGAYVLEVPKDSAMGGTNWHYITIE